MGTSPVPVAARPLSCHACLHRWIALTATHRFSSLLLLHPPPLPHHCQHHCQHHHLLPFGTHTLPHMDSSLP